MGLPVTITTPTCFMNSKLIFVSVSLASLVLLFSFFVANGAPELLIVLRAVAFGLAVVSVCIVGQSLARSVSDSLSGSVVADDARPSSPKEQGVDDDEKRDDISSGSLSLDFFLVIVTRLVFVLKLLIIAFLSSTLSIVACASTELLLKDLGMYTGLMIIDLAILTFMLHRKFIRDDNKSDDSAEGNSSTPS